jgi:hypothetical protein
MSKKNETQNVPEKEVLARPARTQVTVTRFGVEVSKEDTIDVNVFETNPATVSVKAGATVNLGNYESGRVDVMLTVPCYVEEVDRIFKGVKEWVDARVAQEYQELKKSAEGR